MTSETNPEELATLMVGRQVTFKTEKGPANPTEEVLKVENLVVDDYRGVEKVKGLNFSVRRGEIVGIAGIDGNGQTELIEAITGLQKVRVEKSPSIPKMSQEKTHVKLLKQASDIFLRIVKNMDLFLISRLDTMQYC